MSLAGLGRDPAAGRANPLTQVNRLSLAGLDGEAEPEATCGTVELELSQLDRRYEGLRRRAPLKEKRLLSSLAGHGQQAPIIVVSGQGSPHVVVDGYKRVRALAQLRRDVVEATTWSLSELEALFLERQLRAGEPDDALEQGWLLRELRDRFGLTEEELAIRFDRSKSWVSRRLALVGEDLPREVQEQVRCGALGAHGAMKHLVPLARANTQDCLTLVTALGSGSPTSRQLGELAAAVLHGGAEPRRLVLANPWLYLRALAESRKPAEVKKTPVQTLLGEFGALAGIARRLNKRLKEGIAEKLAADEADEVRRCCEQARADTQALFARYQKESSNAGAVAKDSGVAAARAGTLGP